MLSKKNWQPESLAFLGAGLMGFMFIGHAAVLTQPTESVGQMAVNGLVLPLGVLGAVAVWFWASARFFQQPLSVSSVFGFRRRGSAGCVRDGLLVGVGLVLAAIVLVWVSWTAISLFRVEPEQQKIVQLLVSEVENEARPGVYFFFGLAAIVLAPVTEEILFRGVMYPSIKQAGFPRTALWGTSLLFALWHFNRLTFLPLTVIALALTLLYERRDNLLAPIVAHATFNAGNFLLILSGADLESAVRNWLN